MQQADLDAGRLSNTATATASTPPGSPPLPPPTPSQVTVPSDVDAGRLELEKKAQPEDVDGDGRIGVGDRIAWTMEVTNVGGTTVTGIVVSDPTAGRVTCPLDSLAPGVSMTCTTAPHVVTTGDAAKGHVRNTAVVTGDGGPGRPVRSTPAVARVDVEQPQARQPPGRLASTGAFLRELLVHGLLMLLSGTAVVALSRRRRWWTT